MTPQIIRRLNQLNQQFYQTISEDFSQSRAYPWAGWEKLLPFIEKLGQQNGGKITVLDIGCGNGRFGVYLREKLPHVQIHYMGLDQDPTLLKLTQQKLQNLDTVQLMEMDIVEQLLAGQALSTHTYDLVVCFGVLHHIPSNQLRQKLFQSVESLLKPDGVFVCTAWQFLDDNNLGQRAFKPEHFELSPEELEKGDYLLPWKNHTSITRYAHWVDAYEMSALLAATALREQMTFVADGHDARLNLYVVATK